MLMYYLKMEHDFLLSNPYSLNTHKHLKPQSSLNKTNLQIWYTD